MDRANVRSRLQEVFRGCFFDDEIVLGDDTTADDVDGWDSLAHVRLLMLIEDAFHIQLPGVEASQLDNVGQLIDLVMRLQNASAEKGRA